MSTKADYVLEEAKKPFVRHHCHWPGCPTSVPPSMWGCKRHWFRLPKRFRDAIWDNYRPGQEISKDPSNDYMKVAIEIQNWCKSQPL